VDFRQQYNRDFSLEPAQTVSKSADQRGYPFHFKIDQADQELGQPIEVRLYDVPTTLNTIVESVKLFLPSEKIESNSEQEYLEARELQNFVKVLKQLVHRNVLTKKHVTISDNTVV
jgi:hypothetical protein